MKKYNIYQEGLGYWSKSKVTSTSEENYKRNKLSYWSEFKDSGSINNRIEYSKLGALLQVIIMKILTNDLRPIILDSNGSDRE